MREAKSTSRNTRIVNCALGILVAANGIFLAGFVNSQQSGVKNYIKRTFTVTPPISTTGGDIIAGVKEYMSNRRENNLLPKSKNIAITKTILEIAQTYRAKGRRSTDLKAKVRNYSLALLELQKLSPKKPAIVKQTRPMMQRIKILLQPISTVGVKLGDSRSTIELLYGLADKTEISRRHYPVGSIIHLTYDRVGLRFGLKNNRIFAINIRSNFKGIIGGVQIGDNLKSIMALYKGRVENLPGNNFSYKTDDRQLSFVFSNQDDRVDGIKLFDEELHGDWTTSLR